MSGDDPPFLQVDTEVSAKYRGAFCEAKIKKIIKSVKYKLTVKDANSSLLITDETIEGNVKAGEMVDTKHPESGEPIHGHISRVVDCSTYTVVFDDGDERILRRSQICLKGDKHFVESETLDNLPLSNPEHFGTPVMGGKRERKRSGRFNYSSDQESSSEDTPQPDLTETYKRRHKSVIGRVVCVDQGDKKRSCLVPMLVVLPSAQTLKPKTKDTLVLSSFRDNKFFTHPKKDLKDFTRLVAVKNEDKTLKAAYEKALLFYDGRQLPVSWDKKALLGPEEEDMGLECDVESSDDEPSEEKDHFVAQLYKFMDDRGTPMNKGPCIGNKDLNLYRLFRIVSNFGGYNKVTNMLKWRLVYHKMALPPSNTASHQIKMAYKKYLHAFEDFYRKLGNSMGTSSRPGRCRLNTGRSIFRDRDSSMSPKASPKASPRPKPEPSQVTVASVEPATSSDVAKVKTCLEERFTGTDSGDKVKGEGSKEAMGRGDEKARGKKGEGKVVGVAVKGGGKKGEKVKVEHKLKRKVEEKRDEKKEEKEEKKSVDIKGKVKIGKAKEVGKVKVEGTGEEGKAKDGKAKDDGVKEEGKTKDVKKDIGLKDDIKTKEVKSKDLKKDEVKVKDGKDEVKAKDEGNFKDGKPKDEIVKDVKDVKKPDVPDVRTTKRQIRKKVFDDDIPQRYESIKKDTKPPEPTDTKATKDVKVEAKKKSVKVVKDSPITPVTISAIDNTTLTLGSKLKVKYGKGKTSTLFEAKVMEVHGEGSKLQYLVHYAGWNLRYDEWIKPERILSITYRAEAKTITPAKSITTSLPPPPQSQEVKKKGRPPQLVSSTVKSPLSRPVVSKSVYKSTVKPRPTRSNSTDSSSSTSAAKSRASRRTSIVTESDSQTKDATSDTKPTDAKPTTSTKLVTKVELEDESDSMSIDIEGTDTPSTPVDDKDTPPDIKCEAMDIGVLSPLKDLPKLQVNIDRLKSMEESSVSVPCDSSSTVVSDVTEKLEKHVDKTGVDTTVIPAEDDAKNVVSGDAKVVGDVGADATKGEKDVKTKKKKEESNAEPMKEEIADVTTSESPLTQSKDVKHRRRKSECEEPKVKKKKMDIIEPTRKGKRSPRYESSGYTVVAGKVDGGSEVEGVEVAGEVGVQIPMVKAVQSTVMKSGGQSPAAKRGKKGEEVESKEGESTVSEVVKEEEVKEEDVEKKRGKKRGRPSEKAKLDAKKIEADAMKESSVEIMQTVCGDEVVGQAEGQMEGQTEGQMDKPVVQAADTHDIESKKHKHGKTDTKHKDKKEKRDKSSTLTHKHDSHKHDSHKHESHKHETHKHESPKHKPHEHESHKHESHKHKSHKHESPKHKSHDTESHPPTSSHPEPQIPESQSAAQDNHKDPPSKADFNQEPLDQSSGAAILASLATGGMTLDTSLPYTDIVDSTTRLRDLHKVDSDLYLLGEVTDSLQPRLLEGGESPPAGDGSTTSNDTTGSSGNLPSSESSNDLVASHKRKQDLVIEITSGKRRRKGSKRRGHKDKHAGSDSDEACHLSPSHPVYPASVLSQPRPSKYNFHVEEGDSLEGEQKIDFILGKIQEMRTIYLSLKAEVAGIDRKRKRWRRKERIANMPVVVSAVEIPCS